MDACRSKMPRSALGAVPGADGTDFAVWSESATRIEVALFDPTGMQEVRRVPLVRGADDVHRAYVEAVGPGDRYGLRADGPYDPAQGRWFDPAKLLLDPYAVAIDRPCRYDTRLAAPRAAGIDTAMLMPKGIVTALPAPLPSRPPCFQPGGLLYELSVRSYTQRHPAIPPALRGTLAALAHPAVIAHLTMLRVAAVELMPITAWIDERHLAEQGLRNAWGYNPVSFLALDPRIAPGGIAELRDTAAALRAAGIGIILDLVYNHSGESDAGGPTVSLRGLDGRAYFRHTTDHRLVNDTGCGNTIAGDHPAVHRLIIDSLRHFVAQAGIDGFRFDLATVLGRTTNGFDRDAPLLTAIAGDPALADRILIAEPWDIGPNGYQLGGFPSPYLEWNDRYRDDLRRFWRGDKGVLGALATRLAGSSDVFAAAALPTTRSVNFVAAHDGFTLADVVAYADKHNVANGEENRDGQAENHTWNHGIEGTSDDPAVVSARRADCKAMLACLFASRGTLMLTAGDEFGRSQGGNNNAYCQDNAISWLDWRGRDRDLEAYVVFLSELRAAYPALADPTFLDGSEVRWLTPAGDPYQGAAWHDDDADTLLMLIQRPRFRPIGVVINRSARSVDFVLPDGRWRIAGRPSAPVTSPFPMGRRAVAFLLSEEND